MTTHNFMLNYASLSDINLVKEYLFHYPSVLGALKDDNEDSLDKELRSRDLMLTADLIYNKCKSVFNDMWSAY